MSLTAPFAPGKCMEKMSPDTFLPPSEMKLWDALMRVLCYFPTDADMFMAGWHQDEVDAACAAYNNARQALGIKPIPK